MAKEELPATAGDIAERFPEVWESYRRLGAATAEAGPIAARERRLLKIALAVGAGSEGAVHSHCRRALDEGIAGEELEHVALLAITTLGFPAAAAAMTWIWDYTRG